MLDGCTTYTCRVVVCSWRSRRETINGLHSHDSILTTRQPSVSQSTCRLCDVFVVLAYTCCRGCFWPHILVHRAHNRQCTNTCRQCSETAFCKGKVAHQLIFPWQCHGMAMGLHVTDCDGLATGLDDSDMTLLWRFMA